MSEVVIIITLAYNVAEDKRRSKHIKQLAQCLEHSKARFTLVILK